MILNTFLTRFCHAAQEAPDRVLGVPVLMGCQRAASLHRKISSTPVGPYESSDCPTIVERRTFPIQDSRQPPQELRLGGLESYVAETSFECDFTR